MGPGSIVVLFSGSIPGIIYTMKIPIFRKVWQNMCVIYSKETS